MTKHVVVVESPAKAGTIKKYLGKDYVVFASYGHVRDLIPKSGAVLPDQNFEMLYAPIERNEKHVAKIAKALSKADDLLLATDPDREGEAISWHLLELLKEQGVLKDKPVKRVAFYQITKKAVREAVSNPRDLAMDLVDAQQTRRALDYLVGFTLSPLLWKKIWPGLSAGRVQSPALDMIVKREAEIDAFEAKEYHSIEAACAVKEGAFSARLLRYDDAKVEQFTFTNTKDATKVVEVLTASAKGKLTIENVEKKQRKRNPTAPFITSTLQQEAARKLGFTTSRTMRIAQQLYEGIDTGEGAVGLITYMRTDSVNMAEEAITEIRELIVSRYGKDNLPDSPKMYKTKAKNAQEAHEAIRPTAATRIPEEIKKSLTEEQFKLYSLVWKRTVASQMLHALIDVVAVDLTADKHAFRANGSTIAFPGFMKVYQEGYDDQKLAELDQEKLLPPLEVGQIVEVNEIKSTQHFTEPPPRFSEASLVKTLEEHGIGRPSTYASIIATLVARGYCTLDNKRFMPTDTGKVVNKFLSNYFSNIVDYEFTARLEDDLDAISRGEKPWLTLLDDFWKPFKALIDEIDEKVARKDVVTEAMDEKCPKCESPLAVRLSKNGRFIGCTAYPDCDYTRNVEGDDRESVAPEVVEGRTCPKCESNLVIKVGRYGKFIGCSGYPKCRHIEPLEKPKDMEIECPLCHKGNMLQRKSRYGKIFYSCAEYPTCEYAVWNFPLKEPCPKCQWPILTKKTTKRRGTEKVCPQKECGHAESWPEGADDAEE